MINKDQKLNNLEKDAYDIIKDCYAFSRNFISSPDQLNIKMEDYASGLFDHTDVPCFTTGDGMSIVFNYDWLERSLPEHSDDVRFFTFHELRHVHQKNLVRLYRLGKEVEEVTDNIEKWGYEFDNYVTNKGDQCTQTNNLNQEIELDANAYALALINLYYLGKDFTLECSLPQEAFEAAEARLPHYLQSKPELKRYMDKQYRIHSGENPVGKRPDPYQPCPCGSGKKFKFCCYKNGIYD